MEANLACQMSTTDVLSLSLIQAINFVLVLTSPIVASKFSKVFTNFFEKTAMTGRKVTSNGLIDETCSKIISKRTIWKCFHIYFLIGLIILFFISFVYNHLNELSLKLNVDYGITYYLLFISIPSYLAFIYPPSIGLIEFAIVFSAEFVTLALKKWRKDFKRDYEKVKFEQTKKENDGNPTILRNSEQT